MSDSGVEQADSVFTATLKPTVMKPALRWSVYLGARSPAKLAIVALALAATVCFGALVLHSGPAGLIAAGLVLFAVREFALPQTFILTSKSAQARCLGIVCSEMDWADVRAIYRTALGVKLSPNADPNRARAEHLRGISLILPPQDREPFERTVQALSGRAVQSLTQDGRR